MTLTSFSNPHLDGAGTSMESDSRSASTSSTDFHSLGLPLSENSEIFLQNGETLMNLRDGGNANDTPKAYVIGSNNVTIGTEFKLKIQGDTQFSITNVYEGGRVEHQRSIEDAQQKDALHLNGHNTPDRKLQHRIRYIFLPSTLAFLLILLIIFLFTFKSGLFPRGITFPPTNPNTTYYISGHPVYDRWNWGALEAKETPPQIPLPTEVVIISHTATESCRNFTQCAAITQKIQYDYLQKGHRDIGFNFLVGMEGGVYVGRGWEEQNNIRGNSLNIAFIGDFTKESLSDVAEQSSQALIEEGVKLGKVDVEYKLVGENQTSPLRYYSPGFQVTRRIKHWKHYFSGTLL